MWTSGRPLMMTLRLRLAVIQCTRWTIRVVVLESVSGSVVLLLCTTDGSGLTNFMLFSSRLTVASSSASCAIAASSRPDNDLADSLQSSQTHPVAPTFTMNLSNILIDISVHFWWKFFWQILHLTWRLPLPCSRQRGQLVLPVSPLLSLLLPSLIVCVLLTVSFIWLFFFYMTTAWAACRLFIQLVRFTASCNNCTISCLSFLWLSLSLKAIERVCLQSLHRNRSHTV